MASARDKGQPSERSSDDAAWQRLNIPHYTLPSAISAFGTPERAVRWIEVLEEAANRHRLCGRWYWRDKWFLADLKDSGLTRQDFERWATKLRQWPVSPEYVPGLAKYMNLEQAETMIQDWGAPPTTERRKQSASELSQLLRGGMDLAELCHLIEDGLTGHQVSEWTRTELPRSEWFQWRARGVIPTEVRGWVRSGLPASEWLDWRAHGVDPENARQLRAAGATKPEVAHQWMQTGMSMQSVREFICNGFSPQEATEILRSGHHPDDLTPSLPGLEEIQNQWTDLFARPRSSAPVFAVHADLTQALNNRFRRALADLGSHGATIGTMFSTYYYGLAFLDGGWAQRTPYGLNGPVREWIVGIDALALLCHRLGVELPRTGRFRLVPSDTELEARWELQRRNSTDLRESSGLLAKAGYRPRLEELALYLRSPEPLPRSSKMTPSETHPIKPIRPDARRKPPRDA